MGSAHARQQALAKAGSSSATVPSANASGGLAGPLQAAGGAQEAAASAGQEQDKISVVFTWTHGGQNVFLAASFNGWREQIPMVRSGNEFSVVRDLPKGVHQYKFIVDDHWRYAPDQPKTQDGQGNMNNVCDISNYHHFQVEVDRDDVCPRFSHNIPDPNDYIQDAPAMPTVLGKSHFCAVPPRPQAAGGGQPPHVPPHSLCDHVYVRQGWDDGSHTAVVVSHRHGRKYSTTVFVARNPFEGFPKGTNFLKKAVVRAPPEPPPAS